jgi:sugar (pentulose or hexulose) kinase
VPGREAKGAIIGFGDVHTRAHGYRAILEGLAYALLVGGMFLLAVSVFVGDGGSIRVAGSVIALGALAFAAALAQIMRHLSSARAARQWLSRSNLGVPTDEVSKSRVG